MEVLHKHCYSQPEKPSRLVAEVPHDIDDLIVRMLSKDPSERPGDGGSVLKELERIRGKLERQGKLTATGVPLDVPSEEFVPPTMAPLPTPLMKRPVVVIPLFLATVVALGIGIYLTSSRSEPSELVAEAEPLLESDNPDDWQKAWDEHLEQLDGEGGPHADTVATAKERVERLQNLRRAVASGKVTEGKARNEAERFHLLAVAMCHAGDFASARATWQRMIAAFDGLEPAEESVRLAKVGLALTASRAGEGGLPSDVVLKSAAQRLADLDADAKAEFLGKLKELYGLPGDRREGRSRNERLLERSGLLKPEDE